MWDQKVAAAGYCVSKLDVTEMVPIHATLKHLKPKVSYISLFHMKHCSFLITIL